MPISALAIGTQGRALSIGTGGGGQTTFIALGSLDGETDQTDLILDPVTLLIEDGDSEIEIKTDNAVTLDGDDQEDIQI